MRQSVRATPGASETGLMVGRDGSGSNAMPSLIGGIQIRAGNVFNGGSLQDPALHYGSRRFRQANRFFADVSPNFLYWPVNTPGDSSGSVLDGWFLDDNNAVALSCPTANCTPNPNTTGITVPGCPETEKPFLGTSWINLHAARYSAKVKAAGEGLDCHEVETCYSELAEIDQALQNLQGGNPLPNEKRLILQDSMAIWNELKPGLKTSLRESEGLAELMTLGEYSSGMIISTTDTLETKLSIYISCDDAAETWKQALTLAIREFSGDTLTEAELTILHTLAESCSLVEGPGVFVARRTLGVAYSDAKLCESPSEGLRMQLDNEDNKGLYVFPTALAPGSQLNFSDQLSGLVELVDLQGKVVSQLVFEKTNQLNLPTNLNAGIYFVKVQGAVSKTFIILIND